MEAIVVCTLGSECVDVMITSYDCYASPLPIYIFATTDQFKFYGECLLNDAENFGDAYNRAIDYAFHDGGYDSVIVANDDIVLRPDTIDLMQEDWDFLKQSGRRVGFLAARSDFALSPQNIRFGEKGDRIKNLRWESEQHIKQTRTVAPIFAALNKEAWDVAKFPPINWYSDNIICYDMRAVGFEHFVSRGYVHHVGSQTIGNDMDRSHEESREWVKKNRPDLYPEFYEDAPVG